MPSTKSDQFPVGGIIFSAADLQEDEGWMLCDGRTLNPSEYVELYQAIKDVYTKEPNKGQFNIPDYLGQFLRGASNSTAADPDKRHRHAINPNYDNAEGGVGTTQEYATKKPNGAPFRATVNHLPKSTHVTHGHTAGSHTGPGPNNPFNQKTCTTGGDKESRPVNIYLNMYIKSSS